MDLNPIEHPLTKNWVVPITYEDYSKLLKGFSPRDMDDRWMCVTDPPDTKGNTVVHFARSWTGDIHFTLTITAGNLEETHGDGAWGKIETITWKSVEPSGMEISEEQAHESAVNLCRNLTGCKLDNA